MRRVPCSRTWTRSSASAASASPYTEETNDVTELQEPLELAALRLAIGEQPSEQLPMLAAEALARGLDSPSLREVAGISSTEVREARDLFVVALTELGIDVPNVDDALWRLVRHIATQIVDGRVASYDGASWIWHHAYHRVEREGDLRVFVGLASEWDDHPNARSNYERQIIEEAGALLAHPEPRRWVKVMAVRGAWPLWHPSPLREMGTAELPIADSLSVDFARWAAEFDVAAAETNSGPSGFKTAADAERFAERGRTLAKRLQLELGEHWHVEYMPTPTTFPPQAR